MSATSGRWAPRFGELATALIFTAIVVGVALAVFSVVAPLYFNDVHSLDPFSSLLPRIIGSVLLGGVPAALISMSAIYVASLHGLSHPYLLLAVGPLLTSLPAAVMVDWGPWGMVESLLPIAVGWPAFSLASKIAGAFVLMDDARGRDVIAS